MRVDLTAIQVKAIVDHLVDAFGEDDERLILDTLEGETDLFELVAKLLDGIERDEGELLALKEQMDNRKVRSDRAKGRVEARREAICALMEAARQDKLTLPEATVSLRTIPAKLVVNDPAAVPDEYTVPAPKPSMDAIKAAFSPDNDNLPNWLRVDPAKPSITVRRK